ncbi:DUF7742 family protein [Roseicitreum antarcticum]|uniref:DUF7742 domain-containing protein n=1 Tax=Roseicitreum antarcticum TaxID=564137 RepID=A0A1H2TYQ5_9RHOB|nr:hypothetical protein [Roseicitreum antarcticum]SDW49076.1 hypothetical protein SAMN04488238_102224 [Roseicitreum antarcticum]
MRQITHGDVTSAARVLLRLPAPDRAQALADMLAAAHVADCHRKTTGRVHQHLGNGTLMAVALARGPGPEPFAGDPTYLAVLAQVIEGVIGWRASRSG